MTFEEYMGTNYPSWWAMGHKESVSLDWLRRFWMEAQAAVGLQKEVVIPSLSTSVGLQLEVPKWEYKVTGVSLSFIEKCLMELGYEGWELVAVRDYIQGKEEAQWLYLKRPIQISDVSVEK